MLAAQTGGKSHLVNISQDDQKGKTEQVYSLKDPDQEPGASYDFGALFVSRGQRILFGDVRGCIMVWDRTKGEIVHGLNHGEGWLLNLKLLLVMTDKHLVSRVQIRQYRPFQ